MRKLFAAAVLAAISFDANAIVLNTLDGVDYEWLELTETRNMSRAEMELELLHETSDFYGYQYASQAQVQSLLLSYASWDGLNGWHGDAGVVAGMDLFIADFGSLLSGGDGVTRTANTVDGYTVQHYSLEQISGLYGLESECGQIDESCHHLTQIFSDAAGNPTMVLQHDSRGWDDSSPFVQSNSIASPTLGSFLVTAVAPVPPPAAVWLFGSGLGLLGWMRRRQTV